MLCKVLLSHEHHDLSRQRQPRKPPLSLQVRSAVGVCKCQIKPRFMTQISSVLVSKLSKLGIVCPFFPVFSLHEKF